MTFKTRMVSLWLLALASSTLAAAAPAPLKPGDRVKLLNSDARAFVVELFEDGTVKVRWVDEYAEYGSAIEPRASLARAVPCISDLCVTDRVRFTRVPDAVGKVLEIYEDRRARVLFEGEYEQYGPTFVSVGELSKAQNL